MDQGLWSVSVYELLVDYLRLPAGAEDNVGLAVPSDDGDHGIFVLVVADLADDVVVHVTDDIFLFNMHSFYLLGLSLIVHRLQLYFARKGEYVRIIGDEWYFL